MQVLVLCRAMVTSFFFNYLIFGTVKYWPPLFSYGTGWAGAGDLTRAGARPVPGHGYFLF